MDSKSCRSFTFIAHIHMLEADRVVTHTFIGSEKRDSVGHWAQTEDCPAIYKKKKKKLTDNSTFFW